jgi:hypothetical protein
MRAEVRLEARETTGAMTGTKIYVGFTTPTGRSVGIGIYVKSGRCARKSSVSKDLAGLADLSRPGAV